MKAGLARARPFLQDSSGNVAMMFGLMLFIILGGAGVAIDFQRSNLIRTEIGEAGDAALLAAARYKSGHPKANDSELTDIARKVFDSALRNWTGIDISAFVVTFDSATDIFALDVEGGVEPLILGVVGQKTIDVGTRSEVRMGKPPLLEVAMALDVTGSMNQNGKISTLKNAARDLVKTLLGAEDADVKIGVVPFAQYVNVGVAHGTESWIDNPGAGWTGCVGSRDYPYNVADDNFPAWKAPGLIAAVCPDPLIPLTADETSLDNMLKDLDADGWTYIPAGLGWAWALLTPTAPFTDGLSFSALKSGDGVKAIILMTDGENTRAPDYPTHESASASLANQLTKELCVNVKKDEIVIYTIAFDVSDFVIKDILEACATTPSHYFDAADADDLIGAFASIATSLRNISLSK